VGSEPRGEPINVEICTGNGEHGVDGVVVVRWGPDPAVEPDEHDHRDKRCAFVPVWERVVVREVPAQHRGFVDQVGVDIVVAETCLGRVEC